MKDKDQPTVSDFVKKNTQIPDGILDPAFRPITQRGEPIRKRQNEPDMDKEVETKAIEKWLWMVDKPLAKKEVDKKGEKPKDE